MLLWASKFTMAKIECFYTKRQVNTFGGNIIFAGDVPYFASLESRHFWSQLILQFKGNNYPKLIFLTQIHLNYLQFVNN